MISCDKSQRADKARLRLAKLGIVFLINSGKDKPASIALRQAQRKLGASEKESSGKAKALLLLWVYGE